MVKLNFIFVAAVVVIAALFLGITLPGTFLSTSTLSVSQATINGVDKILVTMTAGSAGDGVIGEISKEKYPIVNTDRHYMLQAFKEGGVYSYTATDRAGASGTISNYMLKNSCDGLGYFGNGCQGTIDQFKSTCKASNPNNLFYDAGDILNPKWRCYEYRPVYIVSDFNMVGGLSEPTIKVYVDKWTGDVGTSTLLTQYEATLTNTHTYDSLTYGGQNIGTVSMVGLLGTFQDPPSSSGIKALRPAGQTTGYMVIPASSLDDFNYARDNFQTCMFNAKNPSGGQLVIIPPIPGFPAGFTYSESMNEVAVQGCINQYNSAVAILPYLFPSGDYQSLDVSKINTEKKVSLKDNFNIPQIKFELDSTSLEIVRPIATPTSATCNNKELPGGNSIGEFTATVTNGANAGTIYVEASCPSPYTVRTPGASYYFAPFETKQLSISLSISPDSQTKTCSITAKSGDLTKTVSGTCNIKQTASCTNTPKTGFYLDQWCNEYCPLTINDCPAPNVLKAPSTGYPNLCICEAPGPGLSTNCDNDGLCEAGESISTCPNDCLQGSQNGSLTCTPYLQKKVAHSTGGILGIGATTYYTCEYDYATIGAALLIAAGVLLLVKKEKYAKLVGVAGLVILVFSFVADNAMLLALGGIGIFLIALVAAVIAFRLGLI